MLPHNSLGAKMLKKLRVYRGESHPHEAQIKGAHAAAAAAARVAAGARDGSGAGEE
jgi:ribosomal protein L13